MITQEKVLEREFLQTALRGSEALRQDDAKAANREYEKIHELKGEIRELPGRGKAALKRIACSDDPEVQILAAAALLTIDEHFAVELLERIRNSDAGIPSFTAEMTLREWKAGSIREYWS